MSVVDERIVRMVFDNREFIGKVAGTISSLTQLNKATDQVANNSGSGITALGKAFSQAEITATQAGFHIKDVWLKVASIFEYQIAGKIVNVSKQIANAMTFEGINDGFREYELKMGSVQTIMAGTGASLQEVNGYLEELNRYSDKTIYSFADMTNNIGKFTNAGVKLEDAVLAIKGIANEAARSGANANEASRAMYNFSQALSAGYVKLIDWKSIENANMATKEFKDMLLETAAAVGTVEKGADGMYKVLSKSAQGGSMKEAVSATKNFNDSLSYQWMTTEVLTTALKGYATDIRDMTAAEKEAYEAELRSKGLSDEQIQRFEKIGSSATDAASEIKTFTMLIDTLKEAIGSGWAQTFEYIIGDFEQAKRLWTDVGAILSEVIDNTSRSRNEILKAWNALGGGQGGRADVIYALKNAFNALVDVITPIGQALRDIFPPITLQNVQNFTKAIANFSEKLDVLPETADKIRNAARGLFSILDIGLKLVKSFLTAILPMGKGIKTIGGALLEAASSVGKFLYELDKAITESKIFDTVFQGIATVIKTVFGFIFNVVSGSAGEVKSFGDILTNVFNGVSKATNELISKLTILKPIVEGVRSVLVGMANFAGTVFKQIGDSLSGFSFGDNAIGITNVISALIGGGMIAKLMEGKSAFSSLGKTLGNLLETMSGMGKAFSKVMDSIGDTMEAFSKKIEAENLLAIAKALGILAGSLFIISMIDKDKLLGATAAITALMFGLSGAMSVLMKAVNNFSTKDVTKTFKLFGHELFGADATKTLEMAVTLGAVSNALVKMGAAVALMAVGLKIVSTAAEGGHLWDSFLVVSLILAELTGVAVILGKWGNDGTKGARGILTMAAALVIMAQAFKMITEAFSVDPTAAYKALGTISLILGELTAVVIIIDQFTEFSMGGMLGLISMAVSLNLVVFALKSVSDALGQDGQHIWQALGVITIILAELTAVTILMSKFGGLAALGGIGAIMAAGALLIMVQALKQISDALGQSDQHVWQALGVIGASLVILALGLKAMSGSMIGAAGLLVASAALIVLGTALKIIGSMSLAEVGKGLLAIAGSLVILAVGLTAMVGAIPGAVALIIAAAGLNVLASALKKLGSMKIGEIAKALVTMVVALVLVAGVTTALSVLAPGMLIFSAALLVFGVALISVSAGAMMFASALNMLVAVLPMGALAIKALGTAILELVPVIAENLMEAFSIICTKINEHGPEIYAAIKSIILGIVKILVECVPEIAEGALQIILGVYQKLIENVPLLAEAGADLIIAFWKGITDQIPRIADAGYKCAIALINGLADTIDANNEELIDAVNHLMNVVLEAIWQWIAEFTPLGALMPEEMKTGIMDNEDQVRDAFDSVVKTALAYIKDFLVPDFVEAGIDAVAGFIQGIKSGEGDASAAGASLGASSVSGLRSRNGIESHSPSVKGEEAGEDFDAGYIEGIADGNAEAFDAGAALGDSSVDGLTDALENSNIEDSGGGIVDTLRDMFTSTNDATNANNNYADSVNGVDARLERCESQINSNIDATDELAGANLRAEQSYIRLANAANGLARYQRRIDEATRATGSLSAETLRAEQSYIRASNAIESRATRATNENTEATEANTAAQTENAAATGSAGKAAMQSADVMDYASDVVEAFAAKYGELYSSLGQDGVYKVAQYAVRNLAEETYKASLKTSEATEKTKENKASLEDMIKTFTDMKKKLYDSVQSYFEGDKFFQKFEVKTEMSMNALLENMRSNIEGVSNWANQLAALGEKGVSQGLLKYLGELGPKGFEYVNAFSTATADQIQQANEMFAQSALLPDQLSNDVLASYAHAGLNVVQGFANGIDENTALAVAAMDNANITTYQAFTDFWDINSPSKKMYQDGIYLVRGLNEGIRNNSEMPVRTVATMCTMISNKIDAELSQSKFHQYGLNIAQGLASGMEAGIDRVRAAAQALSSVAATATTAFNLISSPSRLYKKYGNYIAEGLALGISGGSSYVERSATMMSEAIRNTIDAVKTIAEDDLGIHPVVSPVLDLSELKKETSAIGSLFPSRSLAMASSIGIGRAQNETSSSESAPVAGAQINFTQNNYSPKELNRYDIYRQTKNQLNMMKGVVKANA